jgi:5,10-methylenetetrahydrofolate reductase
MRRPAGVIAVELRPPRSGLTRGGAMDTWIDLSNSIRYLAAHDAPLFLTDSAVGLEEEENLQHLAANLAGEIEPRRIVPFLTCKHSLDYCLTYAERARARRLEALTVVGGDPGGPPRCLPHAYLLRKEIRGRVPDLALGGWVNPNADPDRQADFVGDPDFGADYLLSQIVSHHDLRAVEEWRASAEKRDIRLPTAYGVFYYRNGKRAALQRLARHFPVPVDAVERAFGYGMSAEEHCARTILALRTCGVTSVYVCNLGARTGGRTFDAVIEEVDRLAGADPG